MRAQWLRCRCAVACVSRTFPGSVAQLLPLLLPPLGPTFPRASAMRCHTWTDIFGPPRDGTFQGFLRPNSSHARHVGWRLNEMISLCATIRRVFTGGTGPHHREYRRRIFTSSRGLGGRAERHRQASRGEPNCREREGHHRRHPEERLEDVPQPRPPRQLRHGRRWCNHSGRCGQTNGGDESRLQTRKMGTGGVGILLDQR